MTERRTFKTYLPASSSYSVARIYEQAAELGLKKTFSQVIADSRGAAVIIELEGEMGVLDDFESLRFLKLLGTSKPSA